jgi:cytochrome c peroxidase
MTTGRATARRLRRAMAAVALLLAGAAWAAGAARPGPPDAPAGLLDFSADERARILAHGPWPPPRASDPGNALSGRPAAVALGRALFFDARLSPDGALACASCHQPQRAFSDGRPRALGRAQAGGPADTPLDRNTPGLLDAAQHRWWGWDGAFDSLWSQALHPLLNPREIGAQPARIAALLHGDATLACLWRRAHGAPPPVAPPADPDALLVPLAKALGAYVASLHSGRTPFDRFRDALARGDRRAAARYPMAAQRGLRLFVGPGRCSLCHAGPLFTHGEFGDIGAPFFVRLGVVDPGRHGGIAALRASRHNLLGPQADPPPAGAADPAIKTRHLVAQHRNFGEFKVQGLRNVGRTAPYLHDGQLPTLDAVLDHYARLSPDRLHADGEQILQPLQLQGSDRADLLAFLRSLDADGPTALPVPARAATDCR